LSKLQSVPHNQHYKDHLVKRDGLHTKILIDNVSGKFPCIAFAILRKSWEMIMNPDVGVYQTTP